MIKISKNILNGFFIIFSSSAFSERVLKDTNIANVDGAFILKSEMDERVSKGPLVIFSSYPAISSASKEEQALEDLINMRLLLNRSKDLFIQVEDSEIQKHVDSMLSENRITLETLKGYLLKENKSFDDYKNDIRQQITVAKYRGRHVFPNARVTEKELLDIFEKKSGFQQKKNYWLQYISLPKGEDKVAHEIYQKLLSKPQFSSIQKQEFPKATIVSDSISFSWDSLSPEYKRALDGLDEKSLTKPINTSSGIQILYIEKIGAQSNEDFAKAKNDLENQVRQEKMKDITESWIRQARQNSKIEIFREGIL